MSKKPKRQAGSPLHVPKDLKPAALFYSLTKDENLYGTARHLLWYLLTRPEHWLLWIPNLREQLGVGTNAVYAALKKLCDLHYLHRVQPWFGGHKQQVEYYVYGTPQLVKNDEAATGSQTDQLVKNDEAAVRDGGANCSLVKSSDAVFNRLREKTPIGIESTESVPDSCNEDEEDTRGREESSSSSKEQDPGSDATLSTEEASLSTRWLKKELLANSTQVHHIVVELGCPVDYLDETKFKAQQEAREGQRWQGLLLSMVEAYDVDQWAVEHGKIIAARMKNLIWWNWPPVRRLIEADPALLATWEEWLLKMADGGCRVRRLFLKGGWDAVEYDYRELYQFGQYFKSIHGNGEFKPQALAAGG